MPDAPERLASRATQSPAISGRMTARVITLLERGGHDPAPVCARSGLTRATLGDPDARIPYDVADRLVEAAAEVVGVANTSLALAGVFDAHTYDAAGLLLCTGANLHEGLERAFAYQRLWGDGDRFSLHLSPLGLAVRFRHPGPGRIARAICSELALIETMGAARLLVDPTTRAEAVRFVHAPLGDTTALAAVFGVAPELGAAENELVFGLATITAPLTPPVELLRAAFEDQARRSLGALADTATTAARVRALCGRGPEWFDVRIADAAERLSMSPRTLQRKLREEGTTFDEVIDGVRRQRVSELLARGASLKETAYLVGFADPGALTRARARWQDGR